MRMLDNILILGFSLKYLMRRLFLSKLELNLINNIIIDWMEVILDWKNILYIQYIIDKITLMLLINFY